MAPSNVRRWYTQDSLLEKWPELAGWRGLQNTAAARDVGNELVAFKPGWGKDQSILQRLGVPITVKYYGDEADAQITRRLDEQRPALFYLWSPHPLLAKYSLSRMSLPAITNVNEFESGYTDYPPDILEKVFALKLAMTAPPVMEMYLRFQIDVRRAAPRRAAPVDDRVHVVLLSFAPAPLLQNYAQTEIMAAVSNEGRPLVSSVCAWLRDERNTGRLHTGSVVLCRALAQPACFAFLGGA